MNILRELTYDDKEKYIEYMNHWDDSEIIVPSYTNFKRYENFEDMIKKLELRKFDQEWLPNTTLNILKIYKSI